MATPNRNLILEDLATTLATITSGNGYKSTVATVARYVADWDGVGASQMPWIGYTPGLQRVEHLPGGLMRMVLPVTIVAHINASGAATKSDLLSDLEDDLIAVLNVDGSRGGAAISTTIIDTQTDEGDPDAMDSRGGSGSLVVNIECAYMRTTSST